MDNADLFALADAAGKAAAQKHTPTPMTVVQHENPFDDSSPIVHQYAPITAGVCGFAWVRVPGNSSFGRFLKSRGCTKGYPTGITYWVSDYGQSYELKSVYARAFAAVLREHGVDKAYAESRLD